MLATLGLVSAVTPHVVVLPEEGSLNVFFAVIGRSGAGKSRAMAVARRLVPAPPEPTVELIDIPIGSGEGLADAYMGTVEEDDLESEKPRKKRVKRQVHYNVFVYVDEGEQLTKQAERSGTTIMTMIRSAFSGETLGQKNAREETTRIVERQNYRLAMVIGYQPEKAAALLRDDESVGGTPQRFVWGSATDQSIPPPGKLPSDPGPLHWRPLPSPGRVEMGVSDAIRQAVDWAAWGQSSGTDEPLDDLDAHRDFIKLKLAALLAILESRRTINEEDWQLAGMIWDNSCAVRSWVLKQVKADEQRREKSATAKAVDREAALQISRMTAADKMEKQRVEGRARTLAQHVHRAGGGGMTENALKQKLASDVRPTFEPAIAIAIDRDWVIEKDGRYYPGNSKPA